MIFSTLLGGAIGLTQVAGASPGSLDAPPFGSGGDASCSLPSRPATCGSSPSIGAPAGANVGGVKGAAAPTSDPGGSEHATTVGEEQPAPPDVQVTKTSDANGTLHEGDPIRYTITVTNVGGTTAEDVEVHDELPAGMSGVDPGASFGGEPCLVLSSVVVGGIPQATVDCGPLALEAGASASVEIQASTDGLCGGFVNRVDVRASNEPAETAGIGNHAEAHDAVEACHPAIALVVTASPAEGPVGASIDLTYAVSNTGDTRLYGITVDDTLGPLGQVDVFSLRPGATERFTATATLGTSPLATGATAVGMDVTGLRVSAHDAVNVSVVSAGGGDGGGDVGETPAGTPFTGARTDAGALAALVLCVVGAALVALTGRRRRPV